MTRKTGVRILLLVVLTVGLMMSASSIRARAQSGAGSGEATPAPLPSDLPKTTISGKIVNENNSAKEVGELEVMLHILDQNQSQVDMLDGKSKKDGTFTITDVPYQVGLSYAAAVVFEEATYYSQIVPAEASKDKLSLEVPVFESTVDTSMVQVEQEHVIFSFNTDGVDIAEIYVLSNLGDKTVKGVVYIPGINGVKGAVRFNLPDKAEFINFQPKDDARFIKFQGGFVDTAPVTPGNMVSQLIVAYLIPYTSPITYQTKTSLPVQSISFVLPTDAGVTLKGVGLSAAEPVTSTDGKAYLMYKRTSVGAGEEVLITFDGKPNIPKTNTAAADASAPAYPLPLLIGTGVLGLGLIGGGTYWWLLSGKRNEEAGVAGDEAAGSEARVALAAEVALDELIEQIARLDQSFEQSEIDEPAYQKQREALKAQARQVLAAQGIVSPAGPAEGHLKNGLTG